MRGCLMGLLKWTSTVVHKQTDEYKFMNYNHLLLLLLLLAG